WTPDHLQNKDLNQIRTDLINLSEFALEKDGLKREVDQAIDQNGTNRQALETWAQQRFATPVKFDSQSDEQVRASLLNTGRAFLRQELTRLEEFVLLNVCDSVWKEHLLAMDHLKSSIGLRGYAEKDPKIEFKREGTQMFYRMLDQIRDQVSDLILKVQISSNGALQARSVWDRQEAQHAQANGSFTQADREAAMQQQGQATVTKTIRRDTPKVKPNDPCPCGSGKKYKKCCGKNHG
ncbi:MAG: hypothetical protein GX629_12330, partial [Phycisphaerae bacterium]|nr:hypothetical protein [Phycisphaerae bacterium]